VILLHEDLTAKIAELNEPEALAAINNALDSGIDPNEMIEVLKNAMKIVGDRFEAQEYFLTDLVMAGEILRQANEILKPRLQNPVEEKKLGKIVFGTVQGDIHDLAKDLVIFMLECYGFEVIDCGIDCPPAVFVEKTRESGATVVGLSGFLTLAYDSMKQTIEAFKAANLRNQVKIMIGGGQIDEQICQYTGADAWGQDATAAVKYAKKWLVGENHD
jgi:methanogenic corrinoid protein MtbC1